MDALNMPEMTDKPYKTVTEWAHMCGHDGHTTILLAAAEILIKNRDKIPQGKTVRLFFQPAEEGAGGAVKMVEDGVMKDVQEVYGLHNASIAPEGVILVKEGIMMAGVCGVKITVKGKGGHGAFPQFTKDCITAACHIHTALHTIQSRDIDSKESFVFTICTFNAGTAMNVFPDDCVMTGTIRAYSESVMT